MNLMYRWFLDYPLELRRYEHGDTLFVTHATSSQTSGLSIDPVIVFPHGNWRGDYTVGTYEGGRTSLCVKYANNPVDQTPVGEDPGFTEPLPGDSSRYCFAGVQWPAAHLWLDHGLRDARPKATPGFWAGSLIHNKRDLSGNLYMRNRYYDPSSGRFTQEDPIGIAGGLNTYGFANGDPASYDDPYGLSATCDPPTPECIVASRLRAAWTELSTRADNARTRLLAFASNLPGLGDANDAGTILTGHDALNNERVGPGGRVAAFAGMVSPVGGSRAVRGLVDGARMSVGDALLKAVEFLGEGYRDMGGGRFQSGDGFRQVRMGDSDILGRHGGGSHMNFETLAPNPSRPGKNMVVDNKHIYLDP